MKEIAKDPLFLIGLVFRLALFFLPAGGVATEFFVPFFDQSVNHPLHNPWVLSPAQYFPYGLLLYMFVQVPQLLLHLVFSDFGFSQIGLTLVGFRITNLIADLFLFMLLRKIVAADRQSLTWLYWLNPAILFINYLHVQFDIFSILFVLLALYSVMKKKPFYMSALFMAAATLCKFHVVLVIPLFLTYYWNTIFKPESFKVLAKWVAIWGVITLAGFVPHILSLNLGRVSVMSPEVDRLFALGLNLGHGVKLELGIALVLALLGRLVLSSRITPRGMLFGAGLIFMVLVLVTAALPAWYIWFLPFICLLLAQVRTRLNYVFVGTSLLYLAYFMPEYLKFDLGIYSGLIFTGLQLSVLALAVAMWIAVVKVELPLLRRNRPLLLGIAGNSGSGKNHLTESLFELFGRQASSIIEGDDYHKWERGNQKWQEYTHLNPRANYLDSLARHTLSLLLGQPISKSHYDHGTGQFTQERQIKSSKNIIVQGLHSFYPRVLRKAYDIKIFISPDEDLRTFWKLRRDVKERGHSVQKVLDSIQSRAGDSKVHIDPQQQWADWIVSARPYQIIDLSQLEPKRLESDPPCYFEHLLANDTPIDLLVENMKKIGNLRVVCEPYLSNVDYLRLEIHGEVKSEQVEAIAQATFESVRQLTRSAAAPVWRGGFDGVNQLICLALIDKNEMELAL